MLHNSHCLKNLQANVNEPSRNCGIGFRRFRGAENLYRIVTSGDLKSCSMGCFSLEGLLESSTSQPMCLCCITPYSASLWDLRENLTQTIFNGHSVFIIEGREIVSRNSWNFSTCYGGKGPSSPEAMKYKDK